MHSTSTRALGRKLLAPTLAAALLLGGAQAALAQSAPPAPGSTPAFSLITDSPEAGYALAIKLSQRGVGATQPDVDERKALRGAYSHDPNSLIAVSQVIATNFQTVAAANNYWRK